MPCRMIDFDQVPYDEQTVADAYDGGGCDGVGAHFDAHPIGPGDCIEIDGKTYRVLAARVKCNGNTVFENGPIPPGLPPDEVHDYLVSPVRVELWLEELTPEEAATCRGAA